ncbi:unnamed protein product [Caenorhabditis angaria]|uniref:Serpentine receptor class gamma n=1 Tax=Caenorhabditis angaria TaxID=860376 RepID=A0A9P1N0H4_9PELO|nr:unnamed protein product [Caenorhabditis angaria]
MAILLLVLVIFVLVILAVPWSDVFFDERDIYAGQFLKSVFDFTVALSAILLPLTNIIILKKINHPGFLRKLRWLFPNQKISIQIHPKHAEKDTLQYFETLKMSWK